MIYWALFLHFYQPIFQFHKVLEKISNESYRPLVKLFKEHPGAKATVNVCGSLTELFSEHNCQDIVADLRQLGQNGQIEFVETAQYHPILPLIPSREAERQILLNRRTNQEFFGPAYKPKGFFPPEMCYRGWVGTLIRSLGYEWVLLSGIAHPDVWPLDFISEVKQPTGALKVFFRDDIISNKISFGEFDSNGFIQHLASLADTRDDIYVITAMDAETFGHHIPDWDKNFLAKVYETISAVQPAPRPDTNMSGTRKSPSSGSRQVPRIKPVTLSELLSVFPLKPSKPPKPSSWSTTKDDLARKNYYPLWFDTGNRIHELQWQHLKLCWELVRMAERIKKVTKESEYFRPIARSLLDKALLSCQFWWANKARGLWSANLIHKGLILQEETMLNAYKAISSSEEDQSLKRACYNKTIICRKIINDLYDLLLAR